MCSPNCDRDREEAVRLMVRTPTVSEDARAPIRNDSTGGEWVGTNEGSDHLTSRSISGLCGGDKASANIHAPPGVIKSATHDATALRRGASRGQLPQRRWRKEATGLSPGGSRSQRRSAPREPLRDKPVASKNACCSAGSNEREPPRDKPVASEQTAAFAGLSMKALNLCLTFNHIHAYLRAFRVPLQPRLLHHLHNLHRQSHSGTNCHCRKTNCRQCPS